MLITFTQMDKASTRRMHLFGFPLYAFTLFVCLVTSSRGAIWFFGIATAVGLIYTFLYSKIYVYFLMHSRPSGTRFVASILGLQVVIGLLLAAAA